MAGEFDIGKKNLNYAEAIAYANSRKVVLPDEYYGKLVGIQRSQAVSVAGLASIEQIKFVVDQLDGVLKNGGTFKDFQKAVKANTLSIDLPPHRLENIFRTNIQASYNRGRWEQQSRVSSTRPYLMYDAINDGRTRPTHAAMDGTILHRNDPFWTAHYPPNGYRCRCTVISLTEAQAVKRGISQKWPDADPDEGWDYNVGADYALPVQRTIDKTVEKLVAQKAARAAQLAKARANIKKKAEPITLKSVQELGRKTLAELAPADGDWTSPEFFRRLEDKVLGAVFKAPVERQKNSSFATVSREQTRAHAQKHFTKGFFVGAEDRTISRDEFVKRVNGRLPLPASWLKAVDDFYGKVRIDYSTSRAFAQQARNNPALSINHAAGDVVLHEFLHLVQVAKPEIQALCEEFHASRTAGAIRKRMMDLYPNAGYGPGELTKEDKYFSAYLGKEYLEATRYGATPKWNAWEVLTMSVQALLGDPGSWTNGRNPQRLKMFKQDRETAEFALGLLLKYA